LPKNCPANPGVSFLLSIYKPTGRKPPEEIRSFLNKATGEIREEEEEEEEENS
jgi:hypothetical protein